MVVDRGLLIRLATKEEVLEEGEAVETSVNSISNVASGLSVERAAASARYPRFHVSVFFALLYICVLFLVCRKYVLFGHGS